MAQERAAGLGPTKARTLGSRLGWVRASGHHQLPSWFFREVCSIRFLFSSLWLLSIFLTGEELLLPGTPALQVCSQIQLTCPCAPRPTLVTPLGLSLSVLLQPQGPKLPCFLPRSLISADAPFSFSSIQVESSLPGPHFGECELERLCLQAGWRLWGGHHWAAGRGNVGSIESAIPRGQPRMGGKGQ